MYYNCTYVCNCKSADPGLSEGRGGARDHLWCGPGLCNPSCSFGIAETTQLQLCNQFCFPKPCLPRP